VEIAATAAKDSQMTTAAITSRESTPVDDVIDQAHEYFRGVSNFVLGEIARFGKITHYDAAEIAHQLNDPVPTSVVSPVTNTRSKRLASWR